MGNPKKDSKHFVPSHTGTQPRGFNGNKGKKMNDTSGQHAQVIQTKGEQVQIIRLNRQKPVGLFCFYKNFLCLFFLLRNKLYLYQKDQGGITMPYNNKPNPDDRSDNVEKLQAMIQNTENNIEAAEESLALTDSDTQRSQIEAKNERRRESIDSFRSEIKDESDNQQS